MSDLFKRKKGEKPEGSRPSPTPTTPPLITPPNHGQIHQENTQKKKEKKFFNFLRFKKTPPPLGQAPPKPATVQEPDVNTNQARISDVDRKQSFSMAPTTISGNSPTSRPSSTGFSATTYSPIVTGPTSSLTHFSPITPKTSSSSVDKLFAGSKSSHPSLNRKPSVVSDGKASQASLTMPVKVNSNPSLRNDTMMCPATERTSLLAPISFPNNPNKPAAKDPSTNKKLSSRVMFSSKTNTNHLQTVKSSEVNLQHVGMEGIDSALLTQTYYHGLVNKKEVEESLTQDGDFLVCILEEDILSNKKGTVMIAVNHHKSVRYVIIGKTKKGRFHISNRAFNNIPELIAFYLRSREALHEKSTMVLKRPVNLPDYIITHDRVKLGQQVGKGAFGQVFKAVLINEDNVEFPVAVKTFNGGESADHAKRAEFMKEARIMRSYQHANIITLIGIASQQEPLMLILEFCAEGSLLDYLKKKGSELEIMTKKRFASEASAGMTYLESQKCIHRDVAARNCLLTAELLLKISDFGLSIKADVEKGKTDDKLPIRYLAPEVMREKKWSHKSDIWAFGVMLHEIFTNGKDPYPGVKTGDVKHNLMYTQRIMEFCPEIPKDVTVIMEKCWTYIPDQRPAFAEVHALINKLDLKKEEKAMVKDEGVKEVKGPKDPNQKEMKSGGNSTQKESSLASN